VRYLYSFNQLLAYNAWRLFTGFDWLCGSMTVHFVLTRRLTGALSRVFNKLRYYLFGTGMMRLVAVAAKLWATGTMATLYATVADGAA
jgi:hypothetical protein